MEEMENTSAGLEIAEEEDFGPGKFAKYQKVGGGRKTSYCGYYGWK